MGENQSKLEPRQIEDLLKDCSLTEEEISKWYKSFIKDCPSGWLRREEFKQIYCRLFPHGDASQFAAHVFRTFDSNNDDKIDFREFLCMIKITRNGTMEERLRWIFNIYDLDSNGYISKDEMEQVFASVYKMAGKNVRYASDESTPERRTKKIFGETDRNNDDLLSFKEFTEGATSDKIILQLLQSNNHDYSLSF